MRTDLGLLLLTNLKLTQLHTGYQTGIFTDMESIIEYIGRTWWTGLCRFLQFTQENFQIEQQHVNTPFREDDYTIMEEISKSQRWTTGQLRQINVCRLHIHVTYMMEIAVNGTSLDPHICKWRTEPYRQNTQSMLQWPIQTCPKIMEIVESSDTIPSGNGPPQAMEKDEG